MKVALVLKQGLPLWLLTVLLFTGCSRALAPAEVPPVKEPGEIQRIIQVEADGLICHYSCQCFWTEDEFSAHFANQAQFKADFKEHFEGRLAKERVSASDYSFSFDSATQSTLIRCDIHDAVSRTENKYTARFEWLELPTGFDLLNFDKISKDTLKAETEINGTAITLTLLFPAPTGNCHWHVWWSD